MTPNAADETIHRFMHPGWCSHRHEDGRSALEVVATGTGEHTYTWPCVTCCKCKMVVPFINKPGVDQPQPYAAPSYASFDLLLAKDGPVAKLAEYSRKNREIARQEGAIYAILIDIWSIWESRELWSFVDRGPAALRDEVAKIIREMKKESK